MRVLLATLLVAGCSWETGFGSEGPVDDPMLGVDAGAQPSGTPCKRPDSALRLCVEFTDSKGADSSPYHMNANASNVGDTTRAGDPAATVFWNSNLDVPENPMLDITPEITFETWLYVVDYPPFGLFTFVRNEDQYAMSLDSQGKLRCWIGTQSTETSLSKGAWHHIACTYDGSKLKAYIDGDIGHCSSVSGPIPTTQTKGTRLVDNLTAGVDDIRIYARALAGNEICTHADKTDCSSSCSE